MLKMFRRKVVYVAVLAVLALPVSSYAFFPFLLPYIGVASGGLATYVEASIWFHVAAGGALLWYHNRANSVKTVDSSGNVRSDAAVTWVSWDQNGNPVAMEGQASARVGLTDMQGMVLKDSASKSRYPSLSEALQQSTAGEIPPLAAMSTSNPPVDAILNLPGGTVGRVTSAPFWSSWAGDHTGMATALKGTAPNQHLEIYGNQGYWYVNVTPATATKVPATPDKAQKNLANNQSPGANMPVDPAFNSDIDQALKDLANDQSPGFNIVHFEDGPPNSNTNPPLLPPPSADPAAVQSRVGSWTRPGATGSTGYSAPGSGAAGDTSGGGTYGGGGTTGPTGSGGTGANTGSGSGTGSGTPGSTPPPTTPMGDPGSADARKTELNFDSWAGMKDKMQNIGPFAFLGETGHAFDNLVASPQAPSFEIPVYGALKIPVSLDVFDPVAAVLRYMEAAAMSVGCVFFAVKFWRGVS